MDLEQFGQQEKFRKYINECQSLGRKKMLQMINDYFGGEPLSDLIRRAALEQSK